MIQKFELAQGGQRPGGAPCLAIFSLSWREQMSLPRLRTSSQDLMDPFRAISTRSVSCIRSGHVVAQHWAGRAVSVRAAAPGRAIALVARSACLTQEVARLWAGIRSFGPDAAPRTRGIPCLRRVGAPSRVFGFQSETQRENFMLGRARFCNGPNREMPRCTALNRLGERIIRSITAMANVRLWIYNRPDLFA